MSLILRTPAGDRTPPQMLWTAKAEDPNPHIPGCFCAKPLAWSDLQPAPPLPLRPPPWAVWPLTSDAVSRQPSEFPTLRPYSRC